MSLLQGPKAGLFLMSEVPLCGRLGLPAQFSSMKEVDNERRREALVPALLTKSPTMFGWTGHALLKDGG